MQRSISSSDHLLWTRGPVLPRVASYSRTIVLDGLVNAVGGY